MHHKKRVNHNKYILFILIGIALLIPSFFVDNYINNFFSSLNSPNLTYFFQWVTNFWFLFFVLVIMTSLFMWEERKADWIIPLWFSFISSGVITYILKFIVGRARPIAETFLFGLSDYSFPSAHTAVCFAVIPILDKEFKTLKWFWVLFAIVIAFSRVFLQAHYLSDVIAGALIGYAIGWCILHLKERYYMFAKW